MLTCYERKEMRKLVVIFALILVCADVVVAHIETTLEWEDGKITGLPERYEPASFDLENREIRIGSNSVTIPDKVWAFLEGKNEIGIHASWYHDSESFPYYLGIQFQDDADSSTINLAVTLESLEFIWLRNDGGEYPVSSDDIESLWTVVQVSEPTNIPLREPGYFRTAERMLDSFLRSEVEEGFYSDGTHTLTLYWKKNMLNSFLRVELKSQDLQKTLLRTYVKVEEARQGDPFKNNGPKVYYTQFEVNLDALNQISIGRRIGRMVPLQEFADRFPERFECEMPPKSFDPFSSR